MFIGPLKNSKIANSATVSEFNGGNGQFILIAYFEAIKKVLDDNNGLAS